jgi:chitodextrinase
MKKKGLDKKVHKHHKKIEKDIPRPSLKQRRMIEREVIIAVLIALIIIILLFGIDKLILKGEKIGGRAGGDGGGTPVVAYVPPTPENGERTIGNHVTIRLERTSGPDIITCWFTWEGETFEVASDGNICQIGFDTLDGQIYTFDASVTYDGGTIYLGEKVITENTAPSMPKNGQPTGITKGNDVMLTWEASTDPDDIILNYVWLIKTGGAGAGSVICSGSTPGLQSDHCTTSDGEDYIAEVKADDGHEYSDKLIWNFHENAAPSKPILKIPANGATLTSSSVRHEWEVSPDPEGDGVTYRVYHGTSDPPGFAIETDQTFWEASFADGTYHWYVIAIDDHDEESPPSDIWSYTVNTGGIPDEDPPDITNVNADPSHDSAEITWNTDEDATSAVWYCNNLPPCDWQTTGRSASYVTDHSVTITGLQSELTYKYKAESCDMAGNCANSSPDIFTTTSPPPDTTPPTIENLGAEALSQTSIRIYWDTDEPADSKVEYGILEAFEAEITDDELNNTHQFTITELSEATTYYYKVTSCDASDNCEESDIYSIATLGCEPVWSWECTDCEAGWKSCCLFDISSCGAPPTDCEDRRCGGGGGGGGETQRTETRTFGTNNLYQIVVTYTSTSTIGVTVSSTSPPSQIPTGRKLFEVYEIVATLDIDEAQVYFKVPKSWINNNDIIEDSIALYRYHNGWGIVSTEKIDETSSELFFKASTDAFSTYGILGRVEGSEDTTPPPDDDIDVPPPIDRDDEPDEEEPADGSLWDTVKSNWLYIIIGLVVLLAVAGALVYFLVIREEQEVSDYDLERLEEYKRRYDAKGFTDEIIRGKLESVGWGKKVLDKIFKKEGN